MDKTPKGSTQPLSGGSGSHYTATGAYTSESDPHRYDNAEAVAGLNDATVRVKKGLLEDK